MKTNFEKFMDVCQAQAKPVYDRLKAEFWAKWKARKGNKSPNYKFPTPR